MGGKDFAKVIKEENYEKRIKQDKDQGEDEERHARTIVRDRATGRKLTEEEIEEQKILKKNPINGSEEMKSMEWGKGLVQNRMEQASKIELELESSAPFARYRNDASLDASNRQKERWGDPMMASIKREAAKARRAAASKNPISDDSDSDNEKKKKKKKNKEQKNERDNSLSVAPIPTERPMFRGDPWPNRFGILPGYRWDGRNRSNGWEEKVFTSVNNKKASATAAHQWSTEDM